MLTTEAFSFDRLVFQDTGWWVDAAQWEILERFVSNDWVLFSDRASLGLLRDAHQVAGVVCAAPVATRLAQALRRLVAVQSSVPASLRESSATVSVVLCLATILDRLVAEAEHGIWFVLQETVGGPAQITDRKGTVDLAGRRLQLAGTDSELPVLGYGLHSVRSESLGWRALSADFFEIEMALCRAERRLRPGHDGPLRVLSQRVTAADRPFDVSPDDARFYCALVREVQRDPTLIASSERRDERIVLVRQLLAVSSGLVTLCDAERVVFDLVEEFARADVPGVPRPRD